MKTDQLHPNFYDHIPVTPILDTAYSINSVNFLFKDETAQESGSFKDRGAQNCMLNLYEERRNEMHQFGVVAASAGNHGQGVARAAQHLNVPATIYVPRSAPSSKLQAMEAYGAQVVRVSGDVDATLAAAEQHTKQLGSVFIHPFNDMSVISGQATVGREIARQSAVPPSKVFVPVGGGGLLAGVCLGLKSHGLPTEVYGVQLLGSDSFAQSYDRNELVTLTQANTLSDGTAVRTAGELGLSIVRSCDNYVATLVVSEAELGRAMLAQDEKTGIIAEPAGCLALAGMLQLAEKNKSKTQERWLGIISGKHRDPARFSALMQSADTNCG